MSWENGRDSYMKQVSRLKTRFLMLSSYSASKMLSSVPAATVIYWADSRIAYSYSR